MGRGAVSGLRTGRKLSREEGSSAAVDLDRCPGVLTCCREKTELKDSSGQERASLMRTGVVRLMSGST